MLRVHGGQVLDGPACQQLSTHLQRQACRSCASIRIQTNPQSQCGTCGCATALRKLRIGDKIPDYRRVTNHDK
eukprot:4474263-Amphidinium_carterae.1